MTEPLPETIVGWIAEVTGSKVLGTRRVPGGASREAWFVDVEDEVPLFLRYDRVGRSAGGLFHPLRVEAEVYLALQDTDVTVPRTLAVHPTEEAMLAERVPGDTWFYRIGDPDEQVQVAQDFIRNLAALHRLDAAALPLPSLGPVKPIREHVLDEIANMHRRATGPDGELDQLVAFALDWLGHNVPAYDGPAVLVQGDTGPGNFMYDDGRVTAVVDWELAHFGDPMDDIAWLSLRTVQDTFTHFPDRLAEYAALSGNAIDEDRVWYYRLFAEMRLAARPPGIGALAGYGDVGNGLIYSMLHRRLLIEALAHVTELDLPRFEPPPDPGPSHHTHLYEACLRALQTIVPRVEDPLAAQWAKGVARVVKYLKEVDRQPSPPEGNGGFVARVWREVQWDNYLMREASGALGRRTWPPLS